MLTYEASERPSAVTLLQHPWIALHADCIPLAPPPVQRMSSDDKRRTAGGSHLDTKETQKDPKPGCIKKPVNQIQTHKVGPEDSHNHRFTGPLGDVWFVNEAWWCAIVFVYSSIGLSHSLMIPMGQQSKQGMQVMALLLLP